MKQFFKKHMMALFIMLLSLNGMSQTILFEDNFETDKSWALTAEFQRDTAKGLADDPVQAYQDSTMLGTDITGADEGNDGKYEQNIGGVYSAPDPDYATSPSFDCSDASYKKVTISFYRWLNIEANSKDQAVIEYSVDGGSSWTNLWTNPDADLFETEWSEQKYTLPDDVLGEADVKIRFGIDQSDNANTTYGGWNIDEFVVKAYTCIEPDNLNADNITETSAKFTWDRPADEDDYEVVYGAPGFDPDNATPTAVSSGSLTVDDLVADTRYEFYVRAVCSSDDKSIWAGPYAFTTSPCTTVKSIKWYESFEAAPFKLRNKDGNTNDWVENTTIVSQGSKSIYIPETSGDVDTFYVKCPIELSGVDKPRLVFKQIANTLSGKGQCYVKISTDDGATYSDLPITAYKGSGDYSKGYFDEDSYSDWANATDADNSLWKEDEFDLSDYKADTIRLMFVYDASNYTAMDQEKDAWYLDSIVVDKTPTLVWENPIIFKEADANNGSISNTTSIYLLDEDFSKSSGTFIEGTDFVTANVPEGLSVAINVINVDSAVISLTGNANNHTNWADIADMKIEFTDTAFSEGNASNVKNYVDSTIAVDFLFNLVFTEISYNPPESNTDSLEYIEIYNADSTTINLLDYTISEGVTYTFDDVDLDKDSYITVAGNQSAVENTFGVTIAGEWTGGLSNGGERIVLSDATHQILDDVTFDDNGAWSSEPDGNGPSLVFCDMSLDNAFGENWKVSATETGVTIDDKDLLGSPNALDSACTCIEVTVTTEPTDTSVCEGNDAAFFLEATGTPNIDYQWYKGDDAISGETNDTLTFAATTASDAGNYKCIVTNSCGEDTTIVVTLTVNKNTVINTQPTDKTACEGDDVTFKVEADGSNLTYQWQKDGSDISGETSASLTLTNVSTDDDATKYKVIVSGDCGEVTSDEVTLTVNKNTVINTQPTSQEVCEGDDVTFTVEADGSNLTYQWQKDGSDISGETSASLTLTNVSTDDDATKYKVIVSGDCGDITSDEVTLTVNKNTVVNTQPTDKTACEGDDVIFKVEADGSNLTYQWQKDGSDISGETSASLTLTNVSTDDDATKYKVIVSGDCGDVTSDEVTLTVHKNTVINTQPTAQEVCDGDDFTFSVDADGSDISYQWYKDGDAISGATNSSYTANASAAKEGNYKVVVSGDCDDVTSDEVALTVNEKTAITTQPANDEVCEDDDASFTVVADGTNLTYKWYKDGSEISGENDATLTLSDVSASDDGTEYKVIVSGDCGDDDTSDVAILTVNVKPTVTDDPDAVEVCEGESATFSVAATGTATLTYQWQKDGSDISGATSSSYTIDETTTDDDADYKCIVTNGCGSTESAVAHLTVNAKPTVDAGDDQSGPEGTQFDLDATVSGGSGSYTYEWTPTDSIASGVDAEDATTEELHTTNNFILSVKDSKGCTNADTTKCTITGTPLSVNPQANKTTICVGESVNLTSNAGGGSGNYAYQWTDDQGGSTKTDENITVNPTVTTVYTIKVTDTSNGDNVEEDITITVNPLPNVTANADPGTSICDGTELTLTGAGASTYTWDNDVTDGVAFTPNVGTITYNVTGTDANGCENTASIDVTVNEVPSLSISTNDATCGNANGSAEVTATGGTGSYTYQWDNDGTSDNDDTKDATDLAQGTYYVTVDDGNCSAIASAVIEEDGAPTVTLTADNTTICEGETVELTAGGADTYTWTGEALDNTTGNIVHGTPTSTGVYKVEGTKDGCTADAEITITVNSLPEASFTYTQDGAVINFTNTSANADSYAWDYGDNNSSTEESPSHRYTANGSYTVILTATNSCGNDEAQQVITISSIGTGIDVITKDNIRIYPNPASEMINIDLPLENVTIQLVSVDGRIVKVMNSNEAPTVQMSVRELANGIYNLVLISNQNKVVVKIVKK